LDEEQHQQAAGKVEKVWNGVTCNSRPTTIRLQVGPPGLQGAS